ncbi:hypothetical protein BDZ89DRAFT_1047312 [Hymenopellis radicata]|nr:hypothetical protein BDZ89DRAFT_1047312 [Hymenopellis radicata]
MSNTANMPLPTEPEDDGIVLLQSRFATLRAENTSIKQTNLQLEGRIQELEAQLGHAEVGKWTSIRKRKGLMFWVLAALVVVVVLYKSMRFAQGRRGFGLRPDGELWVPKRSPNYPGKPVDDFMHLWQ